MPKGDRPSVKHAPYRRFRDENNWYVELDPPGIFTGDLVGCTFACRNCWSSYGLAGKETAKWYSGLEVGKKLTEGIHRTGKMAARISHGEPFLYPDHLVEVASAFVATRRSEEHLLIIETAGLRCDPPVLDALGEIAQQAHSQKHGTGLYLRWSLKALDWVNYLWLTGQPRDVFETVQENFEYYARNTKHLGCSSWSLMDACISDDEEVEDFAMKIDKWLPGLGSAMEVETLKNYHRGPPRKLDEIMDRKRKSAFEHAGLPELETVGDGDE